MYHLSRPLFLHCETPLHAGSGSELGVIDLPIQRERHTGFPKIEGSSLKGALRERAEQVLKVDYQAKPKSDHTKDLELIFGPDAEDEAGLHAGALGFTDARLLLFPVKSMRGVFAWVTCPQVIKRFLQDMVVCRETMGPNLAETDVPKPEIGHCVVTKNSDLLISSQNRNVVLEEYAFEAQSHDASDELANWFMNNLFAGNTWWQEKVGSSLVMLHDEDFRDFVNLSTEVITRVKIDNESGTVADGALFTEEYLPAESILYSLVLAAPVFPVHKKSEDKQADPPKKLSFKSSNEESDAKAVMAFFEDIIHNHGQNRLQAGANATIGKGLIRTTFVN